MLMREFAFDLHELVKLWLALSAGATAIYCLDWRIQAAVLLMCLAACLCVGAWRFVAWLAALMAGLALAGMILCRQWPEATPLAQAFYYFLLKFGPLVAMGVFLGACLNVGRLLRSLERLGAPAGVVITLGACLRFLPTAAAEFGQVRHAMRTRGLNAGGRLWLRPDRLLGYVLVPLLLRSLAVGEELARAAVTRGVEAPGRKSSLHGLDFRPADGLTLAGWTLALAALIALDEALRGGPGGVA